MIFCAPVKAKYMEKNLDITKPCLSERIWPVPWRYAELWFHCNCVFVQLWSVSEQFQRVVGLCFPLQISFHNIRELRGRSTEGKQPQICLESSNHFQIPPGELLICFPWLDENNHWTEILPPQITQFSFLKVCWPCVLCTYHLKTFGSDYLLSRQVKSTLVPEVFS